MGEEITFSFGRNWSDYVSTVTDADIDSAISDIRTWLGPAVEGKSIVDIGSGSGIHSLAFHRLGASSVLSIDVDPHSVSASKTLWEREQCPNTWRVETGSILDERLVESLGSFDIVYSWGVLHHTGDMWRAIRNASSVVAPDGVLWISIYTKGPRYSKDLALKKAFNAASDAGKGWMIRKWILRDMWRRAKRLKNPFGWFSKSKRGMNTYHDLIDWLGGLPYEVADPNEIIELGIDRGFVTERIHVTQQGACSIYLLRSVPGFSGRTFRSRAA